ncbi:hypothetical protein A0O21_09100 [Streptococcus pantholopis]|uniref:Uncharacterized protein n=1 Tax=Streptococcus pantholopis TaxID=1811193 RepID=A0A172Q9S1_9STRE|nr:hypothetical protein A0O21_09100 [Streptococcus pantholopis]
MILIVTSLIGGGFCVRNWLIDKENIKYKAEQDRIALYLVNKYEGIEKIYFISSTENQLAGTHTVKVLLNDSSKIFVTFGDYGQGNYTVRYTPSEFSLDKRESPGDELSLNGIIIKYLGE